LQQSLRTFNDYKRRFFPRLVKKFGVEHPPQDYLRWRTAACPGCSACSSGVPPLGYSCRAHKNGKHIDGSGSCCWA
jgi:hypothetical protein